MTWRKVSQRTVKCDGCGLRNFYWYVDDENGTSQLRERDGVTVHHCTGKVSPAAPVLVSATRPEPTVERAPVTTEDNTEDRERLIPSSDVLDRYIPRRLNGHTDVEAMEIAYLNHKNVLLIGDAGTGKNHLAAAFAAKRRLPLISISFNAGTTTEDLFGMWGFIGGNTVWQDGIATWLVRNGGVLVLDEINACPNEIAFSLHQLLDWRRTLVLVQKGREVVPAHEDFFVIGTMNPDYRGTKPLNEAFKDRFNITLELDYDDSIERRLLKGEDKMRELAKQLRKMFRAGELETPCSTRMLLDYVDNKRLFGDEIARDCFLQRYSHEEKAAVKESMSLHLDGAKTVDLTKDI